MSIVTLTSDLGLKDFYVSAVKAAILSQNPVAVIVDISHQVAPFNIHEAAFQLRSVWQDFPIGTTHVVGINSELAAHQSHLVVHYMGHYFISADNGIFSLLFDNEPEDIFEITLPLGENWTFPMKGVFATAAAHFSRGGSPEFVGKRIQGFNKTMPMLPMAEENTIKAQVIHTDVYGNVYTNVTRQYFRAFGRGREFAISFKRAGFAITKVSSNFNETLHGERMAMFAGNGLLLIAINGAVTGHGGGASQLFGLKVNDIIRIEFYGDPDSEDDLQER